MFALFLCDALFIMALQELKRGREAPVVKRFTRPFLTSTPSLAAQTQLPKQATGDDTVLTPALLADFPPVSNLRGESAERKKVMLGQTSTPLFCLLQ